MQPINTKGFSNFQLKYLAAILMVLDHIQYFFDFTGKIPLFFSYLGRLAAPLFLFCLIEGFMNTHNRTKYILRIYILSVGMGLIQFSFYNIGSVLVRGDGFFPQNQMLASFSILLFVLQGIEWCREKQWLKGLRAVLIPIFMPFLFLLLFQAASGQSSLLFLLNLLSFSILPLHTAIVDGGTITLITGIFFYLFYPKRKLQVVCFGLICFFWDIIRIVLLMPELSLISFFTQAYEWMEIFAVIPMLCYNETRGNGSKSFFYWFYPVHIYALYALSCLCYHLLK